MKRLLPCLIFFGFLAAGHQVKAQSGADGYKATFSSDFKMGKAKYANMVLELWKDWDDNKLDRHDYFSDTITLYFPDGTVIKGKPAAIDASKKYRGSMASATSVLHAWVPLMANNLGQDVVAIWGQETDKMNDGTESTRDIHEVWFFNKDGKVSAMRQWTAKFGAN